MSIKGILYYQVSLKGGKKLVSVLSTSMPVTRTRKETVEAVKTAWAGKNDKESEDEYPENLA